MPGTVHPHITSPQENVLLLFCMLISNLKGNAIKDESYISMFTLLVKLFYQDGIF